MAIQNLRSSSAHKRPIPTVLSAGQIAVNTNQASPGLFFKDSNGDLVKVGPVHIGTSAPNSSPATTAADALVSGTVYQILTVGNTDFTAVGASANTVGTVFTATGAGTGTGTVSGQQGNEKGEQWLDTTGGAYDLKIYDGSAWRSQAGEFVNHTGDTMTGVLQFVSGSASAPGIAFSGDTNTGIFRPGADSVAVTTGGTQRITVDSSGRLGINSTTPEERLHVNGAIVSTSTNSTSSVGGSNRAILDLTSGGARIGHFRGTTSAGSGYLGLFVDSSERLRIDSSGRVGIGTSAAGNLFSSANNLVVGSGSGHQGMSIYSGTTSNSNIMFADGTGANSYAGYIQFSHNQDALKFGIQGNDAMMIDSSRRLLVGTATAGDAAADNLTLHSSGDTGITIRASETDSSSIYFADGTGGTNVYTGAIIYDHATNHMSLHTNSGAERMRIDSSGNVSVGSTTVSGTGVHLRPFGNVISRRASGALQVFEGYQGSTLTSEIKADGSASFAATNADIAATGQLTIKKTAPFTDPSFRILDRNNSNANGVLMYGDGSATFAGGNTTIDAANGLKVSSSSGAFGQLNGDGIYQMQTDGSTVGAQILANGSATFNSSIQSGEYAAGAAGSIQIFNNTASAQAFKIGNTTNGSNIAMKSDGSATFKGAVAVGNTITSSSSVDGATIYSNGTTYISRSGSNNLIVGRQSGTSGNKVVINADGSASFAANVGIGRTSASSRLDLQAASGRTKIILRNVGNTSDASTFVAAEEMTSGNADLIMAARHNVRFFSNLNEKMRINTAGQLLLGTTAEGHESADDFTIETGSHAGMTIRSGTSSQGSIYFSDATNGAGEYAGWLRYDHSANNMTIGTNSTEAIKIDNQQNFGIGGIAPNAKLHVKLDTNKHIYFQGNIGEIGSVPGFQGVTDAGSLAALGMRGSDLRFATGSSERLRIDSSGKVGIGNSAPWTNAEIRGTNVANGVASRTFATPPSNLFIGVDGFAQNTGGSIAFGSDRDSASDYCAYGAIAARRDSNLSYVYSGYLTFSTSGGSTLEERMRITSSGHVGIGVGAPAKKLHVSDTSGPAQIRITGATGSSDIYADTNIYFQPNGSTAVTFKDNGSVGIGVTAPAARLHIAGATGGGIAGIYDTTAGGARIEYKDNGTRRGLLNWDTNSLLLAADSGNSLKFSTNAGVTQHVIIDSSGRLLLNGGADVRIELGTTGTTGTNNRNHIRADGSSLKYNTCSGGLHVFEQNGTERMRITSGGVMQMGDPSGSGNGGWQVYVGDPGTAQQRGRTAFYSKSTTSSSQEVLQVFLGSTAKLLIRADGNLYNAAGGIGTLSDAKLKENIVDATSQWDDIKNLRIRKYNFKEETGHDTHTQIGLVAQEVETVSPGLVWNQPDKDENDNDLGTTTKVVNTSVFYMKAMKALQEAMDRIETLEAKVAALEAG